MRNSVVERFDFIRRYQLILWLSSLFGRQLRSIGGMFPTMSRVKSEIIERSQRSSVERWGQFIWRSMGEWCRCVQWQEVSAVTERDWRVKTGILGKDIQHRFVHATISCTCLCSWRDQSSEFHYQREKNERRALIDAHIHRIDLGSSQAFFDTPRLLNGVIVRRRCLEIRLNDDRRFFQFCHREIRSIHSGRGSPTRSECIRHD